MITYLAWSKVPCILAAFVVLTIHTTAETTGGELLVYDYIVVGSGTAGSVVASRLAERYEYSVLLIEAGGEASPGAKFCGDDEHTLLKQTWQYPTAFADGKTHINNEARFRKLVMHGKVAGGTSVINSCLFTPAGLREFEHLGEHWGAKAWREAYRWVQKRMPILYKDFTSGMYTQFMTTKLTKMAGQNTSDQVTRSHDLLSHSGYRRGWWLSVDAWHNRLTSYESLVRKRRIPNIDVWLNATVAKVIFDHDLQVEEEQRDRRYQQGNRASTPHYRGSKWKADEKRDAKKMPRAVGVEVHTGYLNLDTIRVFATKEVVLAAGALGTPKILTLSGIGDPYDLHRIGIDDVVVPSYAVGKNLKDHICWVGYVQHNVRDYADCLPSPIGMGRERLGIFMNLTNANRFGTVPQESTAEFIKQDLEDKRAFAKYHMARLRAEGDYFAVADARIEDEKTEAAKTEDNATTPTISATVVPSRESEKDLQFAEFVKQYHSSEKYDFTKEGAPKVEAEDDEDEDITGEIEKQLTSSEQFATESEIRVYGNCDLQAEDAALTFTIEFVMTRPKSSGRVNVRSKLPDVPPVLEFPRILEEDYDYLGNMAMWTARQLALTGKHMQIVDEPYSKSAHHSARNTARLYQHPCCTAGVGRVIDDRLRVIGVKGLRVVDASAFDDIPSSHIAAPSMALGYLAAEWISEDDRQGSAEPWWKQGLEHEIHGKAAASNSVNAEPSSGGGQKAQQEPTGEEYVKSTLDELIARDSFEDLDGRVKMIKRTTMSVEADQNQQGPEAGMELGLPNALNGKLLPVVGLTDSKLMVLSLPLEEPEDVKSFIKTLMRPQVWDFRNRDKVQDYLLLNFAKTQWTAQALEHCGHYHGGSGVEGSRKQTLLPSVPFLISENAINKCAEAYSIAVFGLADSQGEFGAEGEAFERITRLTQNLVHFALETLGLLETSEYSQEYMDDLPIEPSVTNTTEENLLKQLTLLPWTVLAANRDDAHRFLKRGLLARVLHAIRTTIASRLRKHNWETYVNYMYSGRFADQVRSLDLTSAATIHNRVSPHGKSSRIFDTQKLHELATMSARDLNQYMENEKIVMTVNRILEQIGEVPTPSSEGGENAGEDAVESTATGESLTATAGYAPKNILSKDGIQKIIPQRSGLFKKMQTQGGLNFYTQPCKVPELLIHHNLEVPLVAMGTGTIDDDEKLIESCIAFLRAGGRLLDTAMLYDNYKVVKECIHLSGIPRDNIMIIAKVMPLGRRETIVALEKTIEAFSYTKWDEPERDINDTVVKKAPAFYPLDYVLVHWPGNNPEQKLQMRLPADCLDPEAENPSNNWKKCRHETYQVLIDYMESGKIKKIGISNYGAYHVEEIAVQFPTYPPQMHQMEVNSVFLDGIVLDHHRKVNEYFLSVGRPDKTCVIVAYGILGGGNVRHMNMRHITQIAERNNVDALELLYSWLRKLDIVSIISSKNADRVRKSLCMFDKQLDVPESDYTYMFEIATQTFKKTYAPYPDAIL